MFQLPLFGLSFLIFVTALNFFAHYYFDHIPGEKEHNFGLSLPDFVRNFAKGKKLRPLADHVLQDVRYSMLAQGTQKHFTRDARFHGSEYFKATESSLTALIKPVFQKLDIARYWFASHLLAEMMIDRVLMKKHPQLLDNYYTDLQTADTGTIAIFLGDLGMDDLSTFQERLGRFNSSQYLRQYVNDPALIYSLNRIYIFTGAGKEWSKEQYTELQKLVPEAESLIFESIPDLLLEMQ